MQATGYAGGHDFPIDYNEIRFSEGCHFIDFLSFFLD